MDDQTAVTIAIPIVPRKWKGNRELPFRRSLLQFRSNSCLLLPLPSLRNRDPGSVGDPAGEWSHRQPIRRVVPRPERLERPSSDSLRTKQSQATSASPRARDADCPENLQSVREVYKPVQTFLNARASLRVRLRCHALQCVQKSARAVLEHFRANRAVLAISQSTPLAVHGYRSTSALAVYCLHSLPQSNENPDRLSHMRSCRSSISHVLSQR